MGKASRIRIKAKSKAKNFNFDEKINDYYLKIDQTLKHEFDNDEQKELFIRNVLKQVCEEAVEACQNPSICPIIEKLFKLANEDELSAILSLFAKDWEKVCCSKTISFATQTLLQCSNKFLGSPSSILLKQIESLQLFLLEQLAFYMQHTSASHIIRAVIEILSGINNPSIKQNTANLLKSTSNICKQHLNKICVEILNLPKLEDHIQNYLSCPVLQSVLICSQVLGTQIQQQFCLIILNNGKLFDQIDTSSNLPNNITHMCSSHLVEVWLTCVDEDLYRPIYKKHFKGKLLDLAKHDTANYILHKLLLTANNEKQFGRMYKEIASKTEDILACNHLKVVTQIAQNCLKFNYKQLDFIKQLEIAFHCYEPESRRIHLFKLLLTLSTFDNYFNISKDIVLESEDNKIENKTQNSKLLEINYFGSQIIQILLKFSNPNLIVTGLNELTTEEITVLCTNTHGSHIVEEFISSTTVETKAKSTFFKKLKGRYLSLACDKMGSRTFDCIWKRADLKIKKEICEELSLNEDKLKLDKFGYFIHSNCAVGTYKKRPHQWFDYQKASLKKQKLFNNFLNDKQV